MKHIYESIIGRRGGQAASPIYLMGAIHDESGLNSKQWSEAHAVLYLTQEEYVNRIDEILEMPGFDTAKGYVNSLIRIGGDVIMWAEEDGVGKIRFFCQSMRSIYGVDKITNLPIKSVGYTAADRFKIVKRIGVTRLDSYKNIYDCFEKNKFFHNLK